MKLAKYSRVNLPEWIYLGGQTLTPDSASVAATLPTTATIFKISAEGGNVYYTINHPASAASPGFVAQNTTATIGPLGNLTGLQIYAAGQVVAHLQYFREG